MKFQEFIKDVKEEFVDVLFNNDSVFIKPTPSSVLRDAESGEGKIVGIFKVESSKQSVRYPNCLEIKLDSNENHY